MARHPSTTGTACVIAASCCSQWSLFVAVIVMAESCLFGAAGVSGGPSSVKGTRGSEAIQVDTHASVQYSSVDALFPDLRGLTQAPARAASSAATRPASTKAVKVDGGTIEYLHAEDILDHQSTTATPASGFDSSKVKDDGRGWPTWGPGRAQGSGLHLRRSLEDVLVVMFATMANESLSERFDSSERVFLSLAALRKLRMEYNHITYKALHGRVWDLAPSGAIGVVLCFSALGSRDHNGQHQLLVATASLEGGEVVVTGSEEERCLGDGGCSLRVPMRTAVERVRCAMGVTLADLFEVLEAAVNKRRLLAGRGVLYGRKTCVVRNGSTSWPFSAVRRSRGGTWVCLSCRTSDVTCDHAGSALAAAKAAEDGTETVSETEETDEDEADLVSLFNSDPAKHQEASGAVEGPPHLPSATLPLVPVNRVKWRARSNESRHLVPPLVAQRERAELMRALRDPSHRVSYPAGAQCPYCLVGRASKTPVRDKVATVEFEDGVVLAAVKVWRCHKCLYRVLPDGKARGVVFSSSCTAYSEAFLFEVAVNLARNGSSLHSTAYLREAFVELHTGSKYPPTTDRLRSVTTLRQALLLYLSLVLKDLP
ncbi:hypothetical protein BU14_0060s0043 [Porphyra umbilicalis]|uniref:HMG domain-containing protein n=1 Tax=Porphyra umbilicalis TaxID=2786 RepID=A0A1X6PH44_PORUM|nr:hypothetical protein BU14_0060s0043 [Porphyra umbilicalis]|eukprot:OSX80078.1 hypothetical protein BU14_0060s0043 [Porphyra umbilicalis]